MFAGRDLRASAKLLERGRVGGGGGGVIPLLSVLNFEFFTLEGCLGQPEKVETWGPLQLGLVGVIFWPLKGQ